ncbi:MAG: TonB-dependent receptor domain-containing protein [Chthoniobacterales bacterium]
MHPRFLAALVLTLAVTPTTSASDFASASTPITGSYVSDSEADAPLPLAIYTQLDFAKHGANTLAEGLRRLPSYLGTTATENDSNRGNGSALANLFALGPENTLTLIDGRRAFAFEDLNAIPFAALTRVEVLKHGSALYGTDATAGAVNVVLLNGPGATPYDGAEMGVLYGNTTDRDAHVRQAYVRAGVATAKVAIAAAAEYYDRAALYSRDRAISATGDLRRFGGSNANSPTYAGRVSIITPVTLLGGRVLSGQLVLSDLSTNQARPSSYRRFDEVSGTDPSRFNFRAFTPSIPAQEKYSYYITGSYQVFGKALQIYGHVLYSKTKQENGLAPAPFAISGSFNGRNEARASAFNPFGSNLGSVRYRLVNELGLRESFYDKDYYRYVAGLKGDISLKDNALISHLGYDTAIVYDRFDQDRVDSGDARRDFIRALIAPVGYTPAFGVPPLGTNPTGTFNPFIGQNATPVGTALTYVNGVPTGQTAPYNNLIAALPYTEGGAAYVGHSLFHERDWLADAKIDMHLFPNLYNGGLRLAVGYEHRQSAQESVPDAVQLTNQQLGFNSANRSSDVRAVDSGFSEIALPLLTHEMNVPGFHALSLGAAYRFEATTAKDQLTQRKASFDNGDAQVTLRYQPYADLAVQAAYAQSHRSPTRRELFEPTLLVPTFTQPIIIFPPPATLTGGNPAVRPETSDTYSAGFTYAPHRIRHLRVAANAFQIYSRGLIPASTPQLAQLIALANFNTGGAYSDRFSPPSGDFDDYIDATSGNFGKRLVNGLDVSADYSFETAHFGTFTASLGYNYFFTWKAETIAPLGSHSFRGDYSHDPLFLAPGPALLLSPGAIPYHKGFLRGEWQWRGFDFNATANYVSSYLDDSSFLLGAVETSGSLTNPQYNRYRRVSDYATLDLQLSYEFAQPGLLSEPALSKDNNAVVKSATSRCRLLDGMKLTVGVNNAFDRNPPTVLAAPNDNYDTSLYSIRNRYYYVAISRKF